MARFDYLDRVGNLDLSFAIGVSETGMVVRLRESDGEIGL